MGSAVVDYALLSRTPLPTLDHATVSLRVARVLTDWSDHAMICLSLPFAIGSGDSSVLTVDADNAYGACSEETPTILDNMAARAIALARTPDEMNAALYGPLHCPMNSCHHRRAAAFLAASTGPDESSSFAVFWGFRDRRNLARACAPSTSANYAILAAVYAALSACEPDVRLVLYTASTYAIHSFCHLAGENDARGWSCANADILQGTVALLRERACSVEFRWLASGAENGHYSEALRLARSCLRTCDPHLVFVYSPSGDLQLGSIPWPKNGLAKVWTTLSRVPPQPQKKHALLRAEDLALDGPPDVHSGTLRELQVQADNLKAWLACASAREWWTLVRSWTDPKAVPPRVSVTQLRDSFAMRLNPPEMLPVSFDAEL